MLDGFSLSAHALHQMRERNIQESWLEEALSTPERILYLADQHGNTHYFKRIPDFGYRWLHVVVNPNASPNRVVTLFFDRRVK